MIQNTVNNSRFQTDELLKASIEIQNAQEDAILLEKKLYSQICNDINKSSQDVYVISKKIAFIDVITNFANLAIIKNFTKPNLIEETSLDIVGGRHPVVEESLLGKSQEFIIYS